MHTLDTNELKTQRKTKKKYIFMKTAITVLKMIQLFT